MDPAGAQHVLEMSRQGRTESDCVPGHPEPRGTASPPSPRQPHPEQTHPWQAACVDPRNWDLLFERRFIPFAADNPAEELGRVRGEAPSGLQNLTACSPLS